MGAVGVSCTATALVLLLVALTRGSTRCNAKIQRRRSYGSSCDREAAEATEEHCVPVLGHCTCSTMCWREITKMANEIYLFVHREERECGIGRSGREVHIVQSYSLLLLLYECQSFQVGVIIDQWA